MHCEYVTLIPSMAIHLDLDAVIIQIQIHLLHFDKAGYSNIKKVFKTVKPEMLQLLHKQEHGIKSIKPIINRSFKKHNK